MGKHYLESALGLSNALWYPLSICDIMTGDSFRGKYSCMLESSVVMKSVQISLLRDLVVVRLYTHKCTV